MTTAVLPIPADYPPITVYFVTPQHPDGTRHERVYAFLSQKQKYGERTYTRLILGSLDGETGSLDAVCVKHPFCVGIYHGTDRPNAKSIAKAADRMRRRLALPRRVR